MIHVHGRSRVYHWDGCFLPTLRSPVLVTPGEKREELQRATRHLPLMLFDHGQDVVGKVARVLGEPEELLELSLEELHLGLLPGQSVPHALQDTRSTAGERQTSFCRLAVRVIVAVSIFGVFV